MTATNALSVRGTPGVRLVEPRDPVVERAWRRLQEAGGVRSPFQSWQWFDALAADDDLCPGLQVLVVSDDGGPIGLVPFELATDHRGLRVVVQPGASWLAPDHCDVIATAGAAPAVATAAAERLRGLGGCDALDFDGLRDGHLFRALDTTLGGPRHVRREAPETVLPFVDLTTAPPDRLVSRNTRKQMRRAARDAEAAGGGFAIHTDPDEVTAHLPEMMDLHDARFGDESEVYRGPARRAFHLRAARALASDGFVRLYRLAHADESVALLYALVWGDHVYAYGGGIRPSAGTPGHALTSLAVVSAAGEGFAVFDLLRGDSDWKRRLASGTAHNRRVRALVASPAALTRSASWLVRRTARRTLDGGRST
jgi:CelD/BcsL family acetyltransferase involved in cellulose biosynthesis